MSARAPRAGGAARRSRPGLGRIRAERLIRSDFAAQRGRVLSAATARLRASGVRLDPADLDACYAQAWQGLYASVLAGERIENPTGWLIVATHRRAIEEWRLLHPGRRVDGAPSEIAGSDPGAEERLDDLDRLRAVFEALRGRLSRRECQAATLCYLQGLTRAQAAQRMGISERRMRKLMDGDGSEEPGVAGKVAELVQEIRAGRWCEQQASLMRAYAYGMLDPAGERHALALAHLRRCPACRAYVSSLRGLSAIVPPGVLPALLSAGLAGGGAVGAAAGVAAAGGTGATAGTGAWLLAGSGLAKLAAGCLAVIAAACVAVAVPVGSRHTSPARPRPRHVTPARRSARAPARPAAPAVAPALRRAPAHAAHRARTAADSPITSVLVPASRARSAALHPPGPSGHVSREFGFE